MLKKEIKQFLKDRDFLSALLHVIQNRKDQKLLDMINGAGGAFFFASGQPVLQGAYEPVYYMIDDINWGTHGFFAIFRNVLELCAAAGLYGFVPCIYLDKTLYTGDGYQGSRNLYEYYFENPVRKSPQEIRSRNNHINADIRHIFILNRMLSDDKDKLISYQEHYSSRYMELMADTLKRHLILKPELKIEFDQEIHKITGNRKTAGLHYRNWAAPLYGHPVPVKMEQLFPYLDEVLEHGFDQIFAATDSDYAVTQLKKRYGVRFVYFEDVIRSKNHAEIQFQKNDRPDNGYYLGREVLRDMYALANCDGFIAGLSQVSLFARIQRQALGREYDFVKIIDNGIYQRQTKKGKAYRKYVNQKAASVIDGKKQS